MTVKSDKKTAERYVAKSRILSGGIAEVSSSEVAKTSKFKNLIKSYQPKKSTAAST